MGKENETDFLCAALAATHQSEASIRETKLEVIREDIQGCLYDPEARKVLVLFLNTH